MNRFRGDLPRLTKLYDQFVVQDSSNFFYHLPQRLAFSGAPTLDYYKRVEDWLSYVPDDQWPMLARKVKATVSIYDPYRFWEKLHDVFSEALGFKVLTTKYRCASISFFRPAETETPDLVGVCDGKAYYLEAKTVNHTQAERLSWFDLTKPKCVGWLSPTIQRKLSGPYEKAVSQLSALADAPYTTKIVLLVFNVDYTVSPIDSSVEDLVLNFLRSIEKEDFPIECWVNTEAG